MAEPAALPTLSTLIVSLLCGSICLRLVMFRREGARYRPGVSLCAWLLAVGTGGYSLTVALAPITGHQVAPVSPFLLVVFVILAVMVWRSRGNVATVLRPNHG
jgi:drug/metabolite transporter (DMT)-like permease|tara:strand:+ start:396 stop:704 length:309 start_codon:yes stop_codon:yes gene_type:complete